MNKGIVIVGIFIVGVITLVCVNLIQNYQNGNELDYYLLEETTEAAMLDAVDYSYYQRSGGIIRVDREKFLESFIRRFADSVDITKGYKIKIIDFNETPPKVSILVETDTIATYESEGLKIYNRVDGILETKYNEKRILENVQ